MERRIELLEALSQEPQARRADAGVAGVVVVEDEHGHDALAVAGGVDEGRVVSDAQVAAKPVDDGAHAVSLPGRSAGPEAAHPAAASGALFPKISSMARRRNSKILRSWRRTTSACAIRPRGPSGSA